MDFYKTIRGLYNKLLLFKKQQQLKKISSLRKSLEKQTSNEACSIKINAQTELQKKEVDEKLKAIIKKYINSPEKLIQFIKSQGIKIYKIKKAEKVLAKIGEEEGFITPLKGINAFVLNFAIGILAENSIRFGLSTKEMIVLDINNNEIYTIARALYKYYGFKNKMPGYDYKSQKIYKRVYNNRNTTSPFGGCSIKDLQKCKEAIARDMESINFTTLISMEFENTKKALAKLRTTNSINL